MWIDRDIEPLVLRRAGQRPVVVLTGARQTGKTSLVRRLFPGHAFVAQELPRGTVDRLAIVCRCAHRFPLTDAVEAVPLGEDL